MEDTSLYAFPDYWVTSNDPSPVFYIFVLVYTVLAFFLIAPLVTWSRSYEKQQLGPELEASAKEVQDNTPDTSESRTPERHKQQSAPSVSKSTAVSSLSGSHAPAAGLTKQLSVKSSRSGLGMLFRELDKIASAEYPDRDPDFQSRLGGRTVASRAATEQSNTHSAATTSRLLEKPMSSLVLDVGRRRWKHRRPIGRVDVIQNAINHEASSISGKRRSLSASDRRRHTKGMSDLASSVLEQEGNEVNPVIMNRALQSRRRFGRGGYSSSSERSFGRSVMSSIVDDITPNDAADANDPGRGNVFVQRESQIPNGGEYPGVKFGCLSGFVEGLLQLAYPGEEMVRVVHSSFPLAVGAMSDAMCRLMIAAFISQYIGSQAMVAYLLVGLFVRLTSEEISGAIVDALSSFVQALLLSGQEGATFLAGQYVQHAILLQIGLGAPLLLLWALTMDDVVFWLVQSEEIASIAQEYTYIVVSFYLVQAVARTCTVVFHICGHEHFESVIDFTSAILQVSLVASVLGMVEGATLRTVGYLQVLVGVSAAVAKVLFPVMRGWMEPFREGMIGNFAMISNRPAFQQLARAVLPFLLGTVLEYSEWEVLTLFMRHLGAAEVGTWALLGALWEVLEALTEGVGEAGAIQVTFLLAAFQPERARKLANSVIYLAFVQSLICTSILFMLGRNLAVLFSSDPTIQHIFNDAITLIGIANVTMAFSQACWSLIGAQGRYRLATSFVFFARWMVTIPTALVTIFAFDYNVVAVSGSLVIGYSTASCALMFVLLRSNWMRLAKVMQAMNMPADKGVEEEEDEEGDPFDDSDDSDDSDGFGFGFGEEDSEAPSRGTASRSRASKSKRRVS